MITREAAKLILSNFFREVSTAFMEDKQVDSVWRKNSSLSSFIELGDDTHDRTHGDGDSIATDFIKIEVILWSGQLSSTS
jgi:hypothetical protein